MQARPRKKKVRQSRYFRCPKCNKLLSKHTRRCRTCHRLQSK